jgi:elongation factor G
MDDDKVDFEKLLKLVQDVFGSECVPFNVPVGQGHDFKSVTSSLDDGSKYKDTLIETIVTVDEAAMEKYLEGTPPSEAELAVLMQRAILDGTLIPIVCVSSKTKVGLKELLDALALCALTPDKIQRKAKNQNGEEVEIKADPNAPVIAQVFKTRIDPFVQKLSFFRIYSGTLKNGQSVAASTSRRGIKISQLFQMQANETKPIEEATPGMIVAVAKLEELQTCATIGDYIMDEFPYPTPMVGLAAAPKSRGDEAKLSGALAKITQEDSTFLTERNEQTKQLVITGMSELHLQVIRERLKRRDKVELDTKEPKIAYRESFQTNAEGMFRHKKQSGGAY